MLAETPWDTALLIVFALRSKAAIKAASKSDPEAALLASFSLGERERSPVTGIVEGSEVCLEGLGDLISPMREEEEGIGAPVGGFLRTSNAALSENRQSTTRGQGREHQTDAQGLEPPERDDSKPPALAEGPRCGSSLAVALIPNSLS